MDECEPLHAGMQARLRRLGGAGSPYQTRVETAWNYAIETIT